MSANKNPSSLISIEEAKKKILKDIISHRVIERVSISDAYNRILAEDIYSPINVPAFDNSAMDGFAINTSALGASRTVIVSQVITAGTVAKLLEDGSVARIFTGAMLPKNADSVIAQENCEYDMDKVQLPEALLKNENIRIKGQDVKKDEKVFETGRSLKAQDIGMLASLGLENIKVFKQLKVAIVSTGNELLEPGVEPELGKIFNSNRFMLEAFLKSIKVQVNISKIVADDLETTKQEYKALAEVNDCVISTGGVSVGDSDFVKQALQELGELNLWKLAIKPGKPFTYGRLAGRPFFGLPGNPVAVFVTFLILVKPAIKKLQGVKEDVPDTPVSFLVKANFELKANKLRQEFLRVSLKETEQGQVLNLYPNQSSGVLSSASFSNGFAIMEIGKAVNKGDLLAFIPYELL